MRDDSDSVRLKLNELLDANARFDLAAKGTTNHCPMALIALANMGASSARLQEFFDMWERKFALLAPPVDTMISRGDWTKHLGNRAAFGALRLCFQDWITDAGIVPVIAAVLQAVPFAPASGAFHAVIRLAYGIEVGHAGEIASGLASLISSHLPIDVIPDQNPTADSIDAGFDHVAQALSGVTLPRDSITSRLRAVAADVRFGKAVLAPPTNVALLDDLAQATIGAYWRKPNFTLLHTVTATRAARIVFAQLHEDLIKQLLPNLWIALCAAYATVGRLPLAEANVPDIDIDWSDVCRMTVASDDDHVIKMTYTCLCEDRRDPSSRYLAAAARLVS
ncbi:questin oxidase family protein [Burkholderia sp. BCC0044]|uniref:questin oxidase family protein n=1 Tax=Burkholderia sp. BCC0044 TaxID=2676295 RepID=UPI00158F64E8|nr:questin oxidase family protein [Burkholderia sp. BCC0044]